MSFWFGKKNKSKKSLLEGRAVKIGLKVFDKVVDFLDRRDKQEKRESKQEHEHQQYLEEADAKIKTIEARIALENAKRQRQHEKYLQKKNKAHGVKS